MEAQRGAKAALGDAVAPRSRDALNQATQAQAPQIVRRATRLSSGGLVVQKQCDPRAQLAVVEAQRQQAEGEQGGQQSLHLGSPKRSAAARGPTLSQGLLSCSKHGGPSVALWLRRSTRNRRRLTCKPIVLRSSRLPSKRSTSKSQVSSIVVSVRSARPN